MIYPTLGWTWLEEIPDRITIRNPDTGERRTIGLDDDIPDGWLPVYGADVDERIPPVLGGGLLPPRPAAGGFPWLVWILIFLMLAAAFTKDE